MLNFRQESPKPVICSPSHPGPGEAEPLFLLPTKVEKKRLQLQKMYDRKAKKKLAMEAAGERIPVPGKHGSPEKMKPGLSDYEKNR